MVGSRHEAAHQIFQDCPELLTPVFRILGVPLAPKVAVEVLPADATEIRPLERRVDSVLRLAPSDGDGFLLAIEAQGRRDGDKAVSWAYYLSYLKAKYGLPALLLVVCQDKATAGWAAGPFPLGTQGWTALSLHPLVLGPDNVPVITSPQEAARDLTMATFSALTHGHTRHAPAILKALAHALGTAEQGSVSYYSELLEIGLGESPARDLWRELMGVGTYFPGRGTLIEETYLKGKAEGTQEGLEKGKEEGLEKGKEEERAQMVLHILDQRGIPVPQDVRDRVTACTDLDTLARWVDRALTSTTAADLFDNDTPI